MQKIVPHFWFDTQAAEAAAFYTSLFDNSQITSVVQIHNPPPAGTAELISLTLAGQDFMAISAGPYFRFNPSISIRIDCASVEEVDAIWGKLSEGGTVLMPLDAYPFSKRYGWAEDRYGLSWQVMYVGDRDIEQKLTPTLMFTKGKSGKAEEAIRFYESVFSDTSIDAMDYYGLGEEPDAPGTVKFASFKLEDQTFAAMDSAQAHDFEFNEAVSFIINCENQEEIDYYWEALSDVPEAENCGWLKDKYGVSWQIVPTEMNEMLQTTDAEKLARVTEATLEMKKLDLAELRRAYEG